jgi:hypothetical protein
VDNLAKRGNFGADLVEFQNTKSDLP